MSYNICKRSTSDKKRQIELQQNLQTLELKTVATNFTDDYYNAQQEQEYEGQQNMAILLAENNTTPSLSLTSSILQNRYNQKYDISIPTIQISKLQPPYNKLDHQDTDYRLPEQHNHQSDLQPTQQSMQGSNSECYTNIQDMSILDTNINCETVDNLITTIQDGANSQSPYKQFSNKQTGYQVFEQQNHLLQRHSKTNQQNIHSSNSEDYEDILDPNILDANIDNETVDNFITTIQHTADSQSSYKQFSDKQAIYRVYEQHNHFPQSDSQQNQQNLQISNSESYTGTLDSLILDTNIENETTDSFIATIQETADVQSPCNQLKYQNTELKIPEQYNRLPQSDSMPNQQNLQSSKSESFSDLLHTNLDRTILYTLIATIKNTIKTQSLCNQFKSQKTECQIPKQQNHLSQLDTLTGQSNLQFSNSEEYTDILGSAILDTKLNTGMIDNEMLENEMTDTKLDTDLLDTILDTNILNSNIENETTDSLIATIQGTVNSKSPCHEFNHQKIEYLISEQHDDLPEPDTQPNQVNIQSSIARESNKLYHCEKCAKVFMDKACLKQHMEMHSDKKRFKCSYCGIAFQKKQSLILHIQAHTHEKSFKCSFFHKKNINKANKKRYELLHEEITVTPKDI